MRLRNQMEVLLVVLGMVVITANGQSYSLLRRYRKPFHPTIILIFYNPRIPIEMVIRSIGVDHLPVEDKPDNLFLTRLRRSNTEMEKKIPRRMMRDTEAVR